MNKKVINNPMINYLFRTSGILLGICFITYGIYLFMHPLDDDIMELIHCITAVFMGIIFIVYGLTGRRYIS